MRAIRPALAALLLGACSSGGGSPAAPDAGPGATVETDGGTPDGGASDGGFEPECTENDTQPCTGTTQGTCTAGERICTQGRWGPCMGRRQPAPGACRFTSCAAENAPNPGCACVPGAVEVCYSAADPSTAGRGSCAFGFRTCQPIPGGSRWSACAGEVLPTAADDCSGRDSNCDNRDNEDCTCTGTASRPCPGVSTGACVPGTQTCTGGTWGPCTGAVQPAKGDCAQASCAGGPNPGCQCVDGATEGCYTGVHGTDGVGTCHGGTRTCTPGGTWGTCTGEVFPIPNLCAAPGCTGGPNPGCE